MGHNPRPPSFYHRVLFGAELSGPFYLSSRSEAENGAGLIINAAENGAAEEEGIGSRFPEEDSEKTRDPSFSLESISLLNNAPHRTASTCDHRILVAARAEPLLQIAQHRQELVR
jgi:hypothetical protein